MGREDVIAALERWIEEHGRQPTFNEWRERRERPCHRTIEVHCGSWAAAIAAAGGRARGRGDYARVKADRRCERCGEPRRHGLRFCSRRCGMLSYYDQVGRGSRYRVQRKDGRYRYRIVAEEYLGRPLADGEVVHHIDCDRRNDAPQNLAVFPSRAEHSAFHWQGGEIRALDGTRWRCWPVGNARLVVSLA